MSAVALKKLRIWHFLLYFFKVIVLVLSAIFAPSDGQMLLYFDVLYYSRYKKITFFSDSLDSRNGQRIRSRARRDKSLFKTWSDYKNVQKVRINNRSFPYEQKLLLTFLHKIPLKVKKANLS